MCGIIGYTGPRPAAPILLEGLSRLEYRGYDSAGIAVLSPWGDLRVVKVPGKVNELRASLEGGFPEGSLGLGHTRWATHGAPTIHNAHPHLDCQEEVCVVHNGIVENYLELRSGLASRGHRFTSQTDTEAIAHLVEEGLVEGLPLHQAVRRAAGLLQGANAVVVFSRREPQVLVAVRLGYAGGLVVGHGKGENFISSDLPALLPFTRMVTFLEHGDVALVTPSGVEVVGLDGSPRRRGVQAVPYDPVSAVKGPYRHFMMKEVSEQPQALMSTLRGRLSFDPPDVLLSPEEVPFSPEEVRAFRQAFLLGMGTSYHAALVGRFYMERLARLPAVAENASEFRYREPLVGPETLVVALTQSGETADTLAAMEEARARGARLLVVCNVEGSQATRLAEGTLYMRAGPEICVLSTKTFLATLVNLYLLALHLGRQRGVLTPTALEGAVGELASLPATLGRLLADHSPYQALAERYFKAGNFLYLGRGIHFPVAAEGALKLKEVSYIHAEAYPAGEMKHGPIALIEPEMPTLAVALRNNLYEKMLNNIAEVKARGGPVIALGTEGDDLLAERADHLLTVPHSSPLLSPVLATVPLQLFAYYVAVRRGCDVDQPRNLAKSVTVE